MRQALVTIAIVLGSRAAAADPYRFGGEPAWFVSGGATAGDTVHSDGGGYVGGELSLVRVREAHFAGAYVDGYHDFGGGGTFATAGPELGWIHRAKLMPIGVGVDGGGALRVLDGHTTAGATGRLFVSLAGTVSVYARYAWLDEHVVQVGVTIKFPLGHAL